jgi:multidrug efflux pump
VQIADLVRANLSGVTGGSLLEATEELPVRVRLSPQRRSSIEDIQGIDLIARSAIVNGNAQPYLPLAALGEFELKPELSYIPHEDGARVNIVQGFIDAGVLPSRVLAGLLDRLDARGFDMPPGYHWEIGGESAERDTAVSNLMASVSVLIVIMGATLVLIFNSFRLAGLLAAVAVLSAGLGMAALWLTGYPFGFMAIVGTMGLMGVAMNDSIVVLAAIRKHPEARAGVPAAVCDVVVKATRHVLSTTLTTVTGFTPLLIAGGAFWPPLAVSIAGGVIGATLLALVLAPSAYILLMCPRCEFERNAQAEAGRPEPAAPDAALAAAL